MKNTVVYVALVCVLVAAPAIDLFAIEPISNTDQLLKLPHEKIESLAGTQPLDWPEADLSARLMRSAHRFVEQQIKKANDRRRAVRGDSDAAKTARKQLSALLGVVEERHSPRMERFRDEHDPAIIAKTDTYYIHQVRWPVFANIMGEGLLIKQRDKAVGQVVVVSDAGQSLEETIGLEPADGANQHDSTRTISRRLADNGFDVIVVPIVRRQEKESTDHRVQRANYTDREWIYRQAFHMGRHVIGYDIQRVLAAVDWFASRKDEKAKIGIVGYGEGGLISLHAAALDTRIEVTLVSGYFDRSDAIWKEPIYRNVWSRLKQFGNAEVAALVMPRQLIIEHSPFPNVTAHKGQLSTPELEAVKSELERIPNHAAFCKLLAGSDGKATGPWSSDALRQFTSHFGISAWNPPDGKRLTDLRASPARSIQERRKKTTDQLESHVQSLVRASEHIRDEFFLYKAMPEFNNTRWSTERQHATADSAKFMVQAKRFRKKFEEQAMGRFAEEILPPNARTRQVVAHDKWTAYDVVLDVHEGLFSWGVLVLPNELVPGEKRPVVVCQHGRNGVPRDTIDGNKTAYNNFAARLAERGFITFAPHNLYRGEDEYRWLDRKANAIGCTLFSFIISQHDAILRWLDSLPFVDGNRIAFYGLSYGGETAVRVPTILEKYCLSICSGDFNQWTRKVAATDQTFSFMNTIEWEMPYWKLGTTFDYAEMAYLMFPRPFMVERGHHDRVARDHWVAHEFAKVRWLYAQFGMSDQTKIEFFQGGHSINGEGTFDFLHRHLRHPRPNRQSTISEPIQDAARERPISRILFGSCIKQEQPLPIFETIVAKRPEVFVFLGDNIYADTTEMEKMRADYAMLKAKPEFSKLMKSCPHVMATWDDHDYGANDAGAEYTGRDESQQVFMEFWNEPIDSARRNRPGVYDAHLFGPPGKRVQIILLDTRYFRGPLQKGERRVGGPYVPSDDPNITMLGESQWKWLEQQLRQPAEVRLIVSSIQCVASSAGQETWSNLPHERQRLFDLISKTKAAGVLIVSGDRHWAELSVAKKAVPYPIYELTTSSFNQIHPRGTPTENRFRAVPTTFHRENFGSLTIEWQREDPSLKLEVTDIEGVAQIEQTITLRRLKTQ